MTKEQIKTAVNNAMVMSRLGGGSVETITVTGLVYLSDITKVIAEMLSSQCGEQVFDMEIVGDKKHLFSGKEVGAGKADWNIQVEGAW